MSWKDENDFRNTIRKSWPWGIECTHRVEPTKGSTQGFPDMLGEYPVNPRVFGYIAVEFKVIKCKSRIDFIEFTPAQVSWWYKHGTNTLNTIFVGLEGKLFGTATFDPARLIEGTTKMMYRPTKTFKQGEVLEALKFALPDAFEK